MSDTPVIPVIWTWKGNLPLSEVQHYIQWTLAPEFIALRELYVHDEFHVRERRYKLFPDGRTEGQEMGDQLDADPKALIYTSRGNLPPSSLKHEIIWENTDDYVKVRDVYTAADGEVVKESAYVYAKRGVELGVEQAAMA